MARDCLNPCMFGSTVTSLLLLTVLPLCVETIGNGAPAADVKRRNIPGMLRVSVNDLSFESAMKEVDKDVDTYVENGEFLVNKTGDNSSDFVVEVMTDPPTNETSSTIAGGSTTGGSPQEQLLLSTDQQTVVDQPTEGTTKQETQVKQQVQQSTQQQQQVQQPTAQQQQQVQQPTAQQQPPQLQQPPKQQSEVQQQQQQQLQQSQQQGPQTHEQQKGQPQQQQQQQQQQVKQPAEQQQPQVQQQQQQQQQPPPPYERRRRHHRKVRRGDSAEEKTKMESMEAEDNAASSKVFGRRKKTGKRRQRRQSGEQKKSSDSKYDKYFRKKTIDDFFRQSSDDVDIDDIAEIRAKRQNNFVPNGIEVDVTMVGDYEGGLFDEQFESDQLMQRDVVVASDVMDPEKDGTLTLNKLSSVLYSNESIDHLQLFSDNPSVSVRWEEPPMMINCWLHKMLAERYEFSPSCKPDGTYYNKQCYLERCWCVDNEGHPRDRKFLTRFAYKKFGSVLYCIPQLHEVDAGNLLLPPEEEFEMVVHTHVQTQVPNSVGIQQWRLR